MKTFSYLRKTIGSTMVILLIILLFSQSDAQNNSNLRTIKNNAFTYGERLDYKVGYSFITAGNGYFQIMPIIGKYQDRKCYDVRFRVYSLESLKWIYQVDDAYRTLLDEQGIFPWMFQQRIREGNYKRDAKAVFDQYNGYAYEDKETFKMSQYSHDIVSAFYYIRTLDLKSMKKGTVVYLEHYFGKKVSKLGVKIHGKQQISVDAGKFNTIVIEPLVVEGGLFKSDGNILIWLSDDELKIPVKVTTKIPIIGDVYAELTKYSGLAGKLSSRVGD